ncbi:MAG TPA: DUF4139 domain-containing protein [Kofleriaceae bacterium]|nr:DUF4139 domain-containing protein [Kofleriaceae bacterium]
MARAALPVVVVALAVLATLAIAGTPGAHTTVVVWPAPPAGSAAGGDTYGGYVAPTGAMITEKRDVDVDSAGTEVRIAGIATTIDPASVQLHDLTDAGTTVAEQRYMPGATTPDEILARHVGDAVTVVTTAGELAGVLRAVDAQSLVLEVGTGDQRRLRVLRRDGYVHEVKLPPGAGADRPSLAWRLATKKPGKHAIEVTYRAEGLAWTPDYVAILDDAAKTIDFSALATVKNQSGATFDGADLVLATGGGTLVAGAGPARPAVPAARFPIAAPVHLGNGESLQVELAPPRLGAKARPVVTFEAMTDAQNVYGSFPAIDCSQLAWAGAGAGHADAAVELDLPAGATLPDGRVRLFDRRRGRLDVLSEDQLHASPGIARIRVAPDPDIVGDRRTIACTGDEHARTIREKIEVHVENRGKQAAEVVVRELMWRWPAWHVDPTDESPHGVRADAQTQEYRVSLPAGGKKIVTYTVIYTW